MSSPALVRVSCQAMGCLCEVYLGGESATQLEETGREALALLQAWESRLSHFNSASEICVLNREAHRCPVTATPQLFRLLTRLKALSEETEGAFDPTAGRIVRAWGLFRSGTLRGERVEPPSETEIRRIVQEIGWRHVELNSELQTVSFLTPFVELHLGAAGKGYIVDEVVAFLREKGVERALVNAGGSSIAAIGAPPKCDAWLLGVANPQNSEKTAARALLRDDALTTSGSMESALTGAGRRVCHLFDPRTGEPIAFQGSISALSPTALEGDALTTGFCVNGQAWTEAYCRRHPHIQALWITNTEKRKTPHKALFCATQSRFTL